MITPEIIVIALNLSMLSFSYFWFFPRIAGTDAMKLSKYDLISSIVALSISAIFFYDTNIEFDAMFFTLDWFWFTLLSFFVLEIPFALWYFKKNGMLNIK